MTFKLPSKKIHKKNHKSCSKFAFLTKSFKEKTSIMFLKLFLNGTIRNIKIHNIFYIFEISKSMEPNKCIPKKIKMKMFIKCFFMNFQSLMGLRKSRCDIPSGITKDMTVLLPTLNSKLFFILEFWSKLFIFQECCFLSPWQLLCGWKVSLSSCWDTWNSWC